MPALGIDLGTTNCCVAADRGGRIEVVPFQNNSRTVPSYVSFWKDEILFGQYAKDRLPNNLENTVYDVKRIIGRKISDDILKEHLKRWKFWVMNNAGKMVVKVKRGGETEFFTPQELSGLLLKELKHKAELYLGEEVTSAIITVPTYFTDAQRQATVEAGRIAGFRDVGLLTEPTAAAIAYNQQNPEKRRLIVFDFGGGTFDVSLVECAKETVTVLAIDGNLDLGGNDIDDRVVDHLIAKYNLNLSGKQLFRLRKMCEDAKKSFSDAEEALIDISEIAPDVVDEIVFARSDFNRLCADIFEQTKSIVERCLQAVRLKPADVDGILMIGGSSKIRCIVEMLEKHFGKTLKFDVNPDEAVAVGAAIYASSADPTSAFRNVQFTDISPYSLGISVHNRPSYDNDEVYKGDLMSVIIPRHTKIPTEITQSYVTAHDYQESIEVNIHSGENTYVKNNRWLGMLTISGLRIAPRGEVKVFVTFKLDKNGILNVTVKYPEKNTSERLTLVLDKGGFTEDDLRGAIDVVQKRFNENLLVQDFKRGKTLLAELCGSKTLRDSYADKCDDVLAWLRNREYSKEDSEALVEKLRELEGLLKG